MGRYSWKRQGGEFDQQKSRSACADQNELRLGIGHVAISCASIPPGAPSCEKLLPCYGLFAEKVSYHSFYLSLSQIPKSRRKWDLELGRDHSFLGLTLTP